MGYLAFPNMKKCALFWGTSSTTTTAINTNMLHREAFHESDMNPAQRQKTSPKIKKALNKLSY